MTLWLPTGVHEAATLLNNEKLWDFQLPMLRAIKNDTNFLYGVKCTSQDLCRGTRLKNDEDNRGKSQTCLGGPALY